MQEVRCGLCQRKLAEAEFDRLKIKCPRCGTLNDVRAMRPNTERHGAPCKTKEASDTRTLINKPPNR
eukprot:6461-Eustigmatos_ZCMA.PRE.1